MITTQTTSKTSQLDDYTRELERQREVVQSEEFLSLVEQVCVQTKILDISNSWQPSDLLPRLNHLDDEEKRKSIRKQALALPKNYVIIFTGDLVTEDAISTYQTAVNKPVGIYDRTGADEHPWAIFTRAWAAEENRHGYTMKLLLELSNLVNMGKVHETIQYEIARGFNAKTGQSPYRLFFFTRGQEEFTGISHETTGEQAEKHGNHYFTKVCRKIAKDERRHQGAYHKFLKKAYDMDPEGVMLSMADGLEERIDMPAQNMFDGIDPQLFQHYAIVAELEKVLTMQDYHDVFKRLANKLGLATQAFRTPEARLAQDRYFTVLDKVCEDAPRYAEVVKKRYGSGKNLPKFSWLDTS